MYLESAGFEQHDLIMLAERLEAWDALCELHHFFNSGGEALGERLPHLLTGATGRSHRTGIEWTCLQERRKKKGSVRDFLLTYRYSRTQYRGKKKNVLPALWLLRLTSRGRGLGSGSHWLRNCSDWLSRIEMIGGH